MISKILVPLDGSKLAECVLPYAEELALALKLREVLLATVTEQLMGYHLIEGTGPVDGHAGPTGERPPPQGIAPLGVYLATELNGMPKGDIVMSEAVGKRDASARRYLKRVAGGFEAKGVKVRTQVLLGDPAEALTRCARDEGSDLIIMASHGRSGISRWTHGSVAEKVFRSSAVPVMMVRAPGCPAG